MRVPLLRARCLAEAGVLHGFTTRGGGASTGPLHGLNLALRDHERPAVVRENWARAAASLDPRLGAGDVALLSQVHGDRVLRAAQPTGPLATLGPADAAVTTVPGLVLAARAADCVPVLLAVAGPRPAVAAVHAGWRGAAAGVVPAAVAALLAASGAAPGAVRAAIGPSISGPAYEVGREVVDALAAAGCPPGAFVVARHAPGKARVDVAAAVVLQLRRAGVRRLERIAACTAGRVDLYSHRTDGPRTGRQAGLIALPPR